MSAYPKTLSLRSGRSITVRPMVTDDAEVLLEFFLKVSEEDRHFLKEDVTSPEVIGQWARGLDYARTLPLLAFSDGRVVADATLHRRRAGAMKHLCEVRVVVDPDFRSLGIGTALMRELIDVAQDSDLDKMLAELVAEAQVSAIEAVEALGFVRLAVLPHHVRDLHGKPHDLVIYELPLGKWRQWWGF